MTNGVSIGERKSVDFARGSDILQEYSRRIERCGEKAKQTFDGYSLGNDGVIRGSSPFMNAKLGGIVTLATPAEAEQAVAKNPDFFRGVYEDIGLVLRSNGDSYEPNDFVAKNLAKQVKKITGRLPTPEKPFRISLKGTDVNENDNSNYGLVFVIGAETEVVEVPEFSYVNNGRTFSRTDERGVPIFEKGGNRIFYAKSQGLSGLFLGGGLGLGSDGVDLADSGDGGRVLVVTSEAGSQKNLYAPEAYFRACQKAGLVIQGNLEKAIRENLD